MLFKNHGYAGKWLSDRSVCSTEFIVYKPKVAAHKSFYHAAIDSPGFTDCLLAHVTGSTGSRQRTQPKATLSYPMPFPGADEIEGFCAYAGPLIKRWQVNEQESVKLARLRNALLPKLITGEIDVSRLRPERVGSHPVYNQAPSRPSEPYRRKGYLSVRGPCRGRPS